ncbi:hypothetical protein POVCU2_0042730 [Plasmodium ovale curtisi]|uniref:Uncharacterized protein n=1 Tax=Plasmodium ovale curtisi TaxID=864141 RepID=A0A1A8W3F5_PLAOA|nr:hypothetical protein POVCU2_0042730 [Plasmodium ovale curtisi]
MFGKEKKKKGKGIYELARGDSKSNRAYNSSRKQAKSSNQYMSMRIYKVVSSTEEFTKKCNGRLQRELSECVFFPPA